MWIISAIYSLTFRSLHLIFLGTLSNSEFKILVCCIKDLKIFDFKNINIKVKKLNILEIVCSHFTEYFQDLKRLETFNLQTIFFYFKAQFHTVSIIKKKNNPNLKSLNLLKPSLSVKFKNWIFKKYIFWIFSYHFIAYKNPKNIVTKLLWSL